MNEEEFQAFYGATSVALRSYLRRVLQDPDRADDVSQESYLRLLASRGAKLSGLEARKYLFTVAANLVRDEWRRANRQEVAVRTKPLEPGNGLAGAQRSFRLKKALDHMPLLYRSLLWLAYAEGYSHREIAAIHHIREKSVKVLLSRARSKMRSELESL